MSNVSAQRGLAPAEARRLTHHVYVPTVLAHTSHGNKPSLPRYAAETANTIAETWVGAIKAHGVDVIGDVEELRPAEPSDHDPDA